VQCYFKGTQHSHLHPIVPRYGPAIIPQSSHNGPDTAPEQSRNPPGIVLVSYGIVLKKVDSV